MTDTSPPAEEAMPEPSAELPALSPEIQAKLDGIKAEIATAEAAAVQAEQAETDRLTKMDAAKAVCFATCGQIAPHIAASTNPRERALLIELENQTHAPHKDALEAAHLESSGQRAGESNPAKSGVTTPLESKVTVLADSSGDAQPV